MTRPLLITDCDEVLLHMVSHFGEWLDQAHNVAFAMEGGDFANALRRRDGEPLAREEVWPLLNSFFRTEMHRQTLVPGAKAALDAIAGKADVVILTNLIDEHQGARAEQLAALGLPFRVVCNQGGKGTPVRALIEEYKPDVVVFVDDLPQHHASVAREAPATWRLHMIAEPLLQHLPPAPDAHARIDDWTAALEWIEARFTGKPL